MANKKRECWGCKRKDMAIESLNWLLTRMDVENPEAVNVMIDAMKKQREFVETLSKELIEAKAEIERLKKLCKVWEGEAIDMRQSRDAYENQLTAERSLSDELAKHVKSFSEHGCYEEWDDFGVRPCCHTPDYYNHRHDCKVMEALKTYKQKRPHLSTSKDLEELKH